MKNILCWNKIDKNWVREVHKNAVEDLNIAAYELNLTKLLYWCTFYNPKYSEVPKTYSHLDIKAIKAHTINEENEYASVPMSFKYRLALSFFQLFGTVSICPTLLFCFRFMKFLEKEINDLLLPTTILRMPEEDYRRQVILDKLCTIFLKNLPTKIDVNGIESRVASVINAKAFMELNPSKKDPLTTYQKNFIKKCFTNVEEGKKEALVSIFQCMVNKGNINDFQRREINSLLNWNYLFAR